MFFPDQIEDICHVLKMGGVIIYPTDTVWGLGCDPYNQAAVNRIYEIKRRDKSKPFLLLVDSIKMLKHYVPRLHPRIETLLVYHKKPLTLIHQKTAHLPEYITAKDGSIAIRIAQDLFCQQLIHAFGSPIVSTSVNRASEVSPGIFTEINPEIMREVEYVVRYRQNDKRKATPSVIAKYNHKGDLDFLRE